MLSLLIADDEKVIRESLAETIDWEAIGIRVVACCANGLEALEAAIDLSPNMVLTDIKMPGLSGLELVERIQQMNHDTEFVLLSGYREFDFAKKAIDLGVSRYLLKPFSEEQVISAISGAIELSRHKQSVKESMDQNEQLQRQIRRYYLEQIQYALFLHEDSLHQAIRSYLLEFPDHDETLLVFYLEEISLQDAGILIPTLLSYINRERNNRITNFFYGQDTAAAILRLPSDEEQQQILRITKATVPTATPVLRTADGLLDATLMLRQSICCAPHIRLLDRTGKSSNLYSTAMAFDNNRNLPGQLLLIAESEGIDAAIRRLRGHLESLDELHTLRANGAQILSGILLHKQMLESDNPDSMGIFDIIYTEQEPKQLIERMLLTAESVMKQNQEGNQIITQVKSYVKRNLHDSNLSLKRIATDEVYLSVDYLSRLFVQETGERFSAYLNRSRVEKAKQLLSIDSSKIYQVAESVGLGHNPRYFSQVFKKYTGMTPSEFIELPN